MSPRNQEKRKYEKPYLSFHCGSLLRYFCIGGIDVYAQKSGKLSKLEAISQQLELTPQQKAKILPILRDELPEAQAIKNDNSIGKI